MLNNTIVKIESPLKKAAYENVSETPGKMKTLQKPNLQTNLAENDQRYTSPHICTYAQATKGRNQSPNNPNMVFSTIDDINNNSGNSENTSRL
ncbi:hypothetical protein M0802_003822 [Mischocyttarus mexicanus]|nr:hypothetical protein M0802_003822 [Mischocyttarus mexicanus]